MRTRSFLALAALVIASAAPAQEAPSAMALMSEARALAKKEHKAVWVIFHASW